MGKMRACNLHFNTILVLTVKNLHGLDGLGNSLSTTDKNAINIESVDKGVGHKGVLGIAGRRRRGLEAGNAGARAVGLELRRGAAGLGVVVVGSEVHAVELRSSIGNLLEEGRLLLSLL